MKKSTPATPIASRSSASWQGHRMHPVEPQELRRVHGADDQIVFTDEIDNNQ